MTDCFARQRHTLAEYVTKITPLLLKGVLLIEPLQHTDKRGSFCETYRQDALAEAGFDRPLVQENVCAQLDVERCEVFTSQVPPPAQDGPGPILDVAVDIPRASPIYVRPQPLISCQEEIFGFLLQA